MNDPIRLLHKAFELLLKAETIDEVEGILNNLKVEDKYKISTESYPQLRVKITRSEIKGLRATGVIKDNLIGHFDATDPLTKLLYALAWKNGDLKKVRHIVQGICLNENQNNESGLVFNQFGRHLSGEQGEPIVDQHVLRAFGIFQAKNNKAEIEKGRMLKTVKKEHYGLIENYKKWLQNDLTKRLREQPNYAYHVDKVLFAIGKKVKVRRNSK
ncbi:MAG: hypothetical protein SH819_02765 [Cytophagales bacterium]|nr:hypothetical protein [Cytophagales bacterium]